MKCKKNRNQTKHKQQTNRPIILTGLDARLSRGCWTSNKEPQNRKDGNGESVTTGPWIMWTVFSSILLMISFPFSIFVCYLLLFLCIRFSHTFLRIFVGLAIFTDTSVSSSDTARATYCQLWIKQKCYALSHELSGYSLERIKISIETPPPRKV